MKFSVQFYLIVFLMTVFTSFGLSQTSQNLSLVGSWNKGMTLTSFVENDRLYLGNGTSLEILDVSTPSSPVLLADYPLPHVVTSIFVRSDTAYIGVLGNGLFLLNVSDPQNIQTLQEYNFGTIMDVYSTGKYIYACRDQDVLILDIRQSLVEPPLSSNGFNSQVMNLFIADNKCYIVTEGNGIFISDMTDPMELNELAVYNLDIYPQDIFVVGNYAYVACDLGLRILDLSNLSNINEIGQLETNGFPYDIYVEGNYAYMSAEEDGLLIVDISYPIGPSVAGAINPNSYIINANIKNNTAYIIDPEYGLYIADITAKNAPSLVGSYQTAVNSNKVFVSGDYAYVGNMDGGLRILNVSNPAKPVQTAAINTGGLATGAFETANYLFVTENDSGMSIYNVIDKANPVLAGKFKTNIPNFYARNLQISSGYAFIAAGTAGLFIVDVRNPNNPVEVSQFAVPGNNYVWDVEVRGNYAYLAAGNYGLAVVDISNLQAPSLAGFWDTSNGSGYGIDIYDDTLFLAFGWVGIVALDIQNPESPTLISNLKTNHYVYDLHVNYPYLYTGESSRFCGAYDISNASSIEQKGFYTTHYDSWGVFSVENLIYTCDTYAGMLILKNDLIVDISDEAVQPSGFALHQNYPNPFNPTTTISYYLPNASEVNLDVYSVSGQKVASLINSWQKQGEHKLIFDASHLPSGIYMVRLQTGHFMQSRKMVLLK